MFKSSKISIIIPVYGVEKYIIKCIESIKVQTFSNFEAILVNDGTKDNSVIMAEEAIAGDERFIIYHKENGGQGSARNLGLDKARGDYIAFIDSDDYVEVDFLKSMYEKIIESKADICTCNVRYVDLSGRTVRLHKNDPERYVINNDYLMAKWYLSNFMCDKLFDRKVFDNVRFDPSLKTNEDVFILFELVFGKKISSVDGFFYNYLQRPAATSKSAPPSFIYDRARIIRKQIDFALKYGFYDRSSNYINYVYLKHFVYVSLSTLARYSHCYDKDVRLLRLEIEPKRFGFINVIRLFSDDKKTSIALLLFKFSPSIFRLLIKVWFRNKAA